MRPGDLAALVMMQYKVTAQFARGEERIIAELAEVNDARLFIAKKSEKSALEKQNIIYRLYEDSDLLEEFNKEHLSVAYAKYAEGNGDLNLVQLPFQLMFKPVNFPEKKEIARFDDKNDANLFVISKCESDDALHDQDLFFLFKNRSLMETLNRVISSQRKKEVIDDARSGKGAKFHPTPLPNRPTPSGGPPDCWIEEDNDK
ncbi:Uncharacterised protein [Fluoribacter dumoffii]|uniref:Uncharacterized protein n=2 Tax=Fluoribacter dumoffii TaxID=463 RepID=A0A377GBM7_9GAMM|nr:hypothetical protein Ldum_1603 [Fluoribacter dumoffii NY 23]STO22215.1 Uncharacterised protein [Fluoribacter dumoffii]